MKNLIAGSGIHGTSARYVSLDVLRGLTIALMVVVNTPGSWNAVYAPFLHAPWHGFTLTDMVFPSFLFVVGNALSFSMSRLEHHNNTAFLQKIFKRTVVFFLIGLFLNAYPFVRITADGNFEFIDFTSIRIFGVLQRIAICYFLAALLLYYSDTKRVVSISILVLVGYWVVMYIFGDSGDSNDPYSLSGNAALKLDLLLLNPANLYHGEGIPFDPEGILSTLPAVVNVIAGFLVGKYIQRHGSNKFTVVKLILAGLAFALLGLLWDFQFPINKKIWTSSFVLLTVGLNILALASLILTIDIAKFSRWTYFFEVFGRNPLILFALSGMIVKTMNLIRIDGQGLKPWLYDHCFLSIANPKAASLLYALAYMMLIWLIGYWMDRKKIYIKV